MGWGESLRPASRCDCGGRLRAEVAEDLVSAAVADRVQLEVALAGEQDRADRMAAFLRSDGCYDPTRVLAEHDAARETTSGG